MNRRPMGRCCRSLDEDSSKDMETKTNVVIGNGEITKDLLTSALDAHGGLSRWREIEAFRLKVSIGGGLWRLKGLPDGLR